MKKYPDSGPEVSILIEKLFHYITGVHSSMMIHHATKYDHVVQHDNGSGGGMGVSDVILPESGGDFHGQSIKVGSMWLSWACWASDLKTHQPPPTLPDNHLQMHPTQGSFRRLVCLVSVITTFVRPSFGSASPENAALAQKYAPQWRFHKDEVYFASTVEWFLANVDEVNDSGAIVNADPTVQTVDDPANQGSGLYLATDIDANRNGWLKGLNPLQNPSNVAVYTFVAPKANGVTDVYYWLFTPFNEGKDVPVVGRVGDHVGDWERLTVRTVNGEATQVDYHAHSDTGSTVPFSEAPKFDNGARPIGYIAKGSHGIWETADTHTYVNAVIFQLQDLTSDDGVYWDTRDSLVTYNFPDTFSGSNDWLNYKGAYGNKGTTDCWWHIFYDECEVVTGPTGPYRTDVMSAAFRAAPSSGPLETLDPTKWDMQGPLSQVLGFASDSSNSSFTIYLNTPSAERFVGLNVTCASTSAKSASQFRLVTTQADLSSGDHKLTVTSPACPPNTSITKYNVGLCTDSSSASCQWATRSRALKAYSKDKAVSGAQTATAIEVEDLDVWSFQ
ncbi:hypothetical protein L218DRAFT_948500 [Marasmius fiardii PR-910]|nr:hypothetical protein L218DRAFT_948500 [Marasmius fiardii PR-910]